MIIIEKVINDHKHKSEKYKSTKKSNTILITKQQKKTPQHIKLGTWYKF
jgi:hypothetical protein